MSGSLRAPVGTALAVAGLAIVSISACRGGGERAVTVPAPDSPISTSSRQPSPVGEPTVATSRSRAAVSAAELQKALLTVPEMPTGFSISSNSADGGKDAPGSSVCAKRYAELSRSNSASTATKADRAFDQGSLTGTYVDQSLTAFGNSGEAQAGVSRLVSVVSRCPKFTRIDKARDRTQYTLAALSFPKLGDQTLAAALTVVSKGLTVRGDLVITRDGPLVQLVTAGSLTGAPIETVEKIVRAGYAKLHRLR